MEEYINPSIYFFLKMVLDKYSNIDNKRKGVL